MTQMLLTMTLDEAARDFADRIYRRVARRRNFSYGHGRIDAELDEIIAQFVTGDDDRAAFAAFLTEGTPQAVRYRRRIRRYVRQHVA